MELRRSQAESSTIRGQRSNVLQRESIETRSERDLWQLIDTIYKSGLIKDINEAEESKKIYTELQNIDLTSSIKTVIDLSYSKSDSIKKSHRIVEWLQKTSEDKVTVPPESQDQWTQYWSSSLNAILQDIDSKSNASNKRSIDNLDYINNIDPDSQLTNDSKMLKLYGTDMSDQEFLLTSIWQLIRSGQEMQAMELATAHKVYWLNTSLQGVCEPYYDEEMLTMCDEMSDEVEVINITNRVGNSRKPIWMKTSWKYADSLFNNKENMEILSKPTSSGSKPTSSFSGILEMSIYAALSNNTKVLLESPLVKDGSWSDRLWVVSKALHENDVMKVVHTHRDAKFKSSSLYPGCDEHILRVEDELINLGDKNLDVKEFNELFDKSCCTPSQYDSNGESFIINLQISIMKGYTDMKIFINNSIKPFINNTVDKKLIIPGHSRVLRIICHYLLWLRYNENFFEPTYVLKDLVSDSILFSSLECYIDHLIFKKQRSLVAVYAYNLSRPRRIKKYAELLQSIPINVAHSTEADEIIALAHKYFPNDVIEITKTVVEYAKDTSNSSKIQPSPKFVDYSSNVDMAIEDESNTPRNVHFENNELNLLRVETNIKSTPFRNRVSTPHTRKPPISSSMSKSNVASVFRSQSDNNKVITKMSREADLIPINISKRDEDQIESLQWLFIKDHHRIEAVKQANSIITRFMIESKGESTSVKALIIKYSNYFQETSLGVGMRILNSLKKEIDDDVNFDKDTNDRELAIEYCDLQYFSWESSICKLRFWQSYIDALKDIYEWRDEISRFNSELERSIVNTKEHIEMTLGRYNLPIKLVSQKCIDSIRRTLLCERYNDYDEYSLNGIYSVWQNAKNNYINLIKFSIKSGKQIKRTNQVKNLPQIYGDIIKILNEISFTPTSYVNEEGVTIEVINPLKDDIETLAEYCKYVEINQDDEAKTLSILNTCKQQLIDIRDGDIVIRMTLINLFDIYIKICSDSATALQQISQLKAAHYWYSTGLRLETLLADDRYSLYKLISPVDLQLILGKGATLLNQMLVIVPEYSLIDSY
jgi:hypothetical protein